MKQISKYIKVVNGTLLAGGLLLTACTSHLKVGILIRMR